MAKPSHILGHNARNQIYRRNNKKGAVSYASSKLLAKKLLSENNLLVPQVYAKFISNAEVRDFDFYHINDSFVIKPAGGNAGKGILFVKKLSKDGQRWLGMRGEIITLDDLQLHISDILEGQYSTYGTEYAAFVEERVSIHPKFKRYVYKGTPDIRVIVYNSVPVMAMLRLPTNQSEGRANLHQGAIGVGVDISTGVTLSGVLNGKRITYLPETKRKLNGLRVPKWTTLLEMAVKAANVAGFAFCGVDLFVHPDKGPMVVELNANPGLDIQLATGTGLRIRLDRVDGLEVRGAEHGVKVGRALFAERFADKVKAEDGLIVVDLVETVKLRDKKRKKWIDLRARMDTGARSSVLDLKLAEDLGLVRDDDVLWYVKQRDGKRNIKRPVIEVLLTVKGRKVRTNVRLVSLKKRKVQAVLGWRDLQGFLVSPSKS